MASKRILDKNDLVINITNKEAKALFGVSYDVVEREPSHIGVVYETKIPKELIDSVEADTFFSSFTRRVSKVIWVEKIGENLGEYKNYKPSKSFDKIEEQLVDNKYILRRVYGNLFFSSLFSSYIRQLRETVDSEIYELSWELGRSKYYRNDDWSQFLDNSEIADIEPFFLPGKEVFAVNVDSKEIRKYEIIEVSREPIVGKDNNPKVIMKTVNGFQLYGYDEETEKFLLKNDEMKYKVFSNEKRAVKESQELDGEG